MTRYGFIPFLFWLVLTLHLLQKVIICGSQMKLSASRVGARRLGHCVTAIWDISDRVRSDKLTQKSRMCNRTVEGKDVQLDPVQLAAFIIRMQKISPY